MNDCIFCKIVSGEMPSEKLMEAPEYIVIRDINPKAPVHLLVISKKHIASLATLEARDRELTGSMLQSIRVLAERLGIAERGFKVVINSGSDGGQLVPHLHFHLLGGSKLMGIV